MYRYVVALANEKEVEVDADSEMQALKKAHRKHNCGVLWAERKPHLGDF